MTFISTRNRHNRQGFMSVLRTGLAEDGGLFIPDALPTLSKDVAGLSYAQTARHIFGLFAGSDIHPKDLDHIVTESLGLFNHPDIAPLRHLTDHLKLLELFHGPTLAFKDYALQFLGQFYRYDQSRAQRKQTLLVATSGDTGSSAIAAVKGIDHLNIVVLHPHNRVSEVQRRQMTMVMDNNVHNLAVEGTFDDCQRLVKSAFLDQELKSKMTLGAVNSINLIRLIAQTIYYVVTSYQLSKQTGQKIGFAVPTGNFGNIYAGWMAKKMGAPIHRLYLGTNRNDILARFFQTGEMTVTTVQPSLSPSMDIQVASNFERFLYECVGGDTDQVVKCMQQFQSTGSMKMTGDALVKAQATFSATAVDDHQTLATIASIYKDHQILIDPHTAVGVTTAIQLSKEKGETVVCLACAHPAKFPEAVKKATGQDADLPPNLANIFQEKERFTLVKPTLEALKSYLLTKVE